MILVTGATGRLGRAVVGDLLARRDAADLAVLVRSPEAAAHLAERGVDVRVGDYDDQASLERAFRGVDVLLLISSPDVTPGTRPRQHRAVIDAAAAADVGRLVYTSAIGAEDGIGFLADHTVTEAAIRASGVSYTLLRNTFYTEEFVAPVVAGALESGVLRWPAIPHPLVTASIHDLAVAAAAVLTDDGHENAVYELRGTGWTFDELAATLSPVSGRPIRYEALSDTDAGSDLAGFAALVRRPEFGTPTADLEKLLGRPAEGLEPVLRAALAN